MKGTRKLLALSLASATAFAACGGEKLVKTGDKLVFMGDSITWYGVTNRHGYVNLVVKGLAANGINVTWPREPPTTTRRPSSTMRRVALASGGRAASPPPLREPARSSPAETTTRRPCRRPSTPRRQLAEP